MNEYKIWTADTKFKFILGFIFMFSLSNFSTWMKLLRKLSLQSHCVFSKFISLDNDLVK